MKNANRYMPLTVLLLASVLFGACAAPSSTAVLDPDFETPLCPQCLPTDVIYAPTTTPGYWVLSAEPPTLEPQTYVLLTKPSDDPYYEAVNQGAQQAAEELGVAVKYQSPATADPLELAKLLNALIAQDVQGVALAVDDDEAVIAAGQAAIAAGIPVVSWDPAVGRADYTFHINPARNEEVGRSLVKLLAKQLNSTGPIAILSTSADAPVQSDWIEWMKKELGKPANAGIQLVETVYGDDDDAKSYAAAQALLTNHPDLKGIIAPTRVGLAAAARAVADAGKAGQVIVTGLGTPNQMREYVKSGAAPVFAGWNPADLGYMATHALYEIAIGWMKGLPGDDFHSGRLGNPNLSMDGNVVLAPLTVFDQSNIDDFDF